MSMLTRASVATVAALLLACGDGGGASAESRDGGGGGNGGSGGSGAAGACDVMGRDVTEPAPLVLSNLTISGERLVFLASDPGLRTAPTIESVGTDGAARTVLHTSNGGRRVRSVYARESEVYFLEDNEDVVAKLELFRVPLSGGMATPLGTYAKESGYIFGVDDTHVYLVRNTDQPVGSVFERVELASGSLATIATITGTGTPSYVSLSGDSVYFYAGQAGAGASNPPKVYGFAKNSDNATPSTLWEVGTDDPCGFPLGGLVATPTRLACGFSAVASRDRMGGDLKRLIEADLTRPVNVLVASDAENLYLIESTDGTTRSGRMKRSPSTRAEVVPVVCDLGRVANQLFDGFFPIQNAYLVVVGAEDVFWVEQRQTGSELSYQLRAAAK